MWGCPTKTTLYYSHSLNFLPFLALILLPRNSSTSMYMLDFPVSQLKIWSIGTPFSSSFFYLFNVFLEPYFWPPVHAHLFGLQLRLVLLILAAIIVFESSWSSFKNVSYHLNFDVTNLAIDWGALPWRPWQYNFHFYLITTNLDYEISWSKVLQTINILKNTFGKHNHQVF